MASTTATWLSAGRCGNSHSEISLAASSRVLFSCRSSHPRRGIEHQRRGRRGLLIANHARGVNARPRSAKAIRQTAATRMASRIKWRSCSRRRFACCRDLQKAQGRKLQQPRLLPHDQMQHHRNSRQTGASQQEGLTKSMRHVTRLPHHRRKHPQITQISQMKEHTSDHQLTISTFISAFIRVIRVIRGSLLFRRSSLGQPSR